MGTTTLQKVSLLSFNGIDDKIDVKYNRELNGNSFTVEAWAMSRQTPDMERSVLTSRPASYRWGYMLYQAPAFGKWEFWLLDKVGQYLKLRGDTVQVGVWTHLAGTYDATSRTARFYVNGNLARWSLDGREVDHLILDYTPQATLGPAHGEGSTNLMRIGSGSTESGHCSGGNFFFNGYIDEVRVWDKARSQPEIQADMKRRLTGQEANLVGYWRLTNVTGGKVSDLSKSKLEGNVCNSNTRQEMVELPEGLGEETNLQPNPDPKPKPDPKPDSNTNQGESSKWPFPLANQEDLAKLLLWLYSQNRRDFRYSYLYQINLQFADLRFCDFSFSYLCAANFAAANLAACNFGYAYLPYAYLGYAYLGYSYLAYTYLYKANLNYANLNYADLSFAYLVEANLAGANLMAVNLGYADLCHAYLGYAYLGYANLSHADLRYADLSHADLSNADLSDADLTGANLTGANLTGTKLDRAKLDGAIFNNVIINEAFISSIATCPVPELVACS
jgi:uncharacterized protein YjbI with pentapeptide repeats